MSNVIPLSRAKNICARFRKKNKNKLKPSLSLQIPPINDLIDTISDLIFYGKIESAYDKMKNYQEYLGWGFNYLVAEMAVKQKHYQLALGIYSVCYDRIKNEPSNKYVDILKNKMSELEKIVS